MPYTLLNLISGGKVKCQEEGQIFSNARTDDGKDATNQESKKTGGLSIHIDLEHNIIKVSKTLWLPEVSLL